MERQTNVTVDFKKEKGWAFILQQVYLFIVGIWFLSIFLVFLSFLEE